MAAMTACAALVQPVHARACAVARRTSRTGDYFRALALSHWITAANLRGYRLGRRDVERDPHNFVAKLRAYWGAAAVADCPPWNMVVPPTPRTLIISWHWPPARRASTQVLASLFSAAPAGAFHVLTRGVARDERDPLEAPAIPVHSVPWVQREEREGTLSDWWASGVAALRLVCAARRLHREAPFQRVMGVYPHRYSLLAAWLTARVTGVPLVAYMHDLCAEALITKSRLKRAFWTAVDRRALRCAVLVAVPTREFALHYRSRGVEETWVLPHCNPPGARPPSAGAATAGPLRVVYAGNVYQAHEDAVAALVEATEGMANVAVDFLCPPTRVVPAGRTRWLPRADAQAALAAADVLVVALSANTPYPREIMGCFPSKIVDYVAAGKPMLAIVPAGSFVDRLVRTAQCGMVVNSQSPADVRQCLEELRDPELRAQLGAGALDMSAQLDASTWMRELSRRLALGAPVDPSTPQFPAVRRITPFAQAVFMPSQPA